MRLQPHDSKESLVLLEIFKRVVGGVVFQIREFPWPRGDRDRDDAGLFARVYVERRVAHQENILVMRGVVLKPASALDANARELRPVF